MNRSNIAGIYNYCDAWCDRCKFTDRCEVAKRNAAFGPLNNWEDVHKVISQSFEEVKALLFKKAEEFGIDLSAPLTEEQEAELKEELEFGRMAKSHPLSVAAMDYMLDAGDWLQSGGKEKIKAALENILLTQEDPRETIAQTEESLEIIQWYRVMIFPKLTRALSNPDPEFDDVLGSAKIAMIAIQRSMEAWAHIYRLLPEQEGDEVLSLLAALEVLHRNCQKQFPTAMAFVRPGLDE